MPVLHLSGSAIRAVSRGCGVPVAWLPRRYKCSSTASSNQQPSTLSKTASCILEPASTHLYSLQDGTAARELYPPLHSVASTSNVTCHLPLVIMPYVPFNTTPSPSSSPKSTAATPSIVLSPAQGILDRSDQSLASNPTTGSKSQRELYKSQEDAASQYRTRYAQYLAATFNMSLQAALAEADTQLAPRRSSEVSEAEAMRIS